MSDLKALKARVEGLYREALDPLGEHLAYERSPLGAEITGPPMVLMVGNHSSGKSSFLNHLLGEDVQMTGLAPTDDAFTILAHGAKGERDGRAIVSDPDLPYAGLASFGPTFLSHVKQRTRNAEILERVTLVDSPGMIDSVKEQQEGRGYDFPGVVRWFAERADIVIVFFDPDKPGTTGETLEVFTSALHDMGHKLRIVMNKVDLLRGIQDFARAYGALCWNLGKVMPRKDLPLVYTNYTPVEGAPPPALPLDDFDRSREALKAEIREAPAVRVDGMVSRLAEHAARLRVHAHIMDAAVKEARATRLRNYGTATLISLAFGGLAALAAWSSPNWSVRAASITLVVVSVALSFLGARKMLQKRLEALPGELDRLFDAVYQRELLVRERSEDLRATWAAVQGRTRKTLETLGVLSFPRVKARWLKRVDRLLDTGVPELRRSLREQLPDLGAAPGDQG